MAGALEYEVAEQIQEDMIRLVVVVKSDPALEEALTLVNPEEENILEQLNKLED